MNPFEVVSTKTQKRHDKVDILHILGFHHVVRRLHTSSNVRGRKIKFLFTFESNYWKILHKIQRKITGGGLCFFFILNNFSRESRGQEIWIRNYYGVGCSLENAIMILINLSKGSVQSCLEFLWVFNRSSEVAQARRKS